MKPHWTARSLWFSRASSRSSDLDPRASLLFGYHRKDRGCSSIALSPPSPWVSSSWAQLRLCPLWNLRTDVSVRGHWVLRRQRWGLNRTPASVGRLDWVVWEATSGPPVQSVSHSEAWWALLCRRACCQTLSWWNDSPLANPSSDCGSLLRRLLWKHFVWIEVDRFCFSYRNLAWSRKRSTELLYSLQ